MGRPAMRVTHVITRLIVGGAQENTIATVLGLRNYPGISVNLISGPTEGPEGSLESLVKDDPGLLTIVPNLVRPVAPARDFSALRHLTAVFRRDRPDIVHTHSGKAGILGRIAARRAGVKLILHTIHGPSFGPFQGSLSNLVFRSAERYAAGFTTHFVTVANAMRDQYVRAGIGRPEDYTRIWSGFSLDPFLQAANDPALRQRLGLEPGDFVIGKIARLFQLKGHEDLFSVAPEVIRQNPSIKFLLVGGGEWLERFRNLARSLGLEKHFIFTGLIPPGEVPRQIGIMNALVHLSRREGLARALPQAMAAGKPVVAYDCDGAGEVCLDGQTGFLVRPGDLPGLSARLLQLSQDPALAGRLGSQGRGLVREAFPVERMVADIHQLYRRLMAAGSSAVTNSRP